MPGLTDFYNNFTEHYPLQTYLRAVTITSSTEGPCQVVNNIEDMMPGNLSRRNLTAAKIFIAIERLEPPTHLFCDILPLRTTVMKY